MKKAQELSSEETKVMDEFLGLSSSSAVSPVTLQVSAGEAGSTLACDRSGHPHLAVTEAGEMLCSSVACLFLEQHFPRSLKGFVYQIHMLSNVLSALRAGYDSVLEIPLAINYTI